MALDLWDKWTLKKISSVPLCRSVYFIALSHYNYACFLSIQSFQSIPMVKRNVSWLRVLERPKIRQIKARVNTSNKKCGKNRIVAI